MALTSCDECGNPVSTRASACPCCGAPIPTSSIVPADGERNEPMNRHLRTTLVMVAVFGCALVGSLLYFDQYAQRSSVQRVHPAADSAVAAASNAQRADPPAAPAPAANAPAEPSVSGAFLPGAEYVPQPDPYYPVPTTDSVTTTTTTEMDGQLTGAHTVPSRRPSDQWLIESLYGQRVRVARRLLDELWWTIEAGEITFFTVTEDWEDPAGVSWGARVVFTAQADGEGITVRGLLRYYGDGGEGNRHMFRDFITEDVERLR